MPCMFWSKTKLLLCGTLTKTACDDSNTLLTRAITAKVAESLMTIVSIPDSANDLAMSCPLKWGAPSQTTT